MPLSTPIPMLAIHLPGGWEWIVIVVIILLLFGHRLPGLGKSLGKGIVEFKKGMKGAKDELDELDREVDDAGAAESRKLDAKTTERRPGDAIGERTREKDEA